MVRAEPTARPIHRGPEDGAATWVMGSLFEERLGGEESGGAMGVMIVTQPPGIATPLHVHTREAEVFYLLEGSMLYEAGGELFHLVPGSFLYLPKDVPHRFRVVGSGPVRFLGIVAPAGVEAMYREIGVPAERREPPGGMPVAEEMARWAAIAPSYGIQAIGPPLPA